MIQFTRSLARHLKTIFRRTITESGRGTVHQPPSKSMFVGKMVHSGLECFYRHKQPGVMLPAGDVVQRMCDFRDGPCEAAMA